MKTGRRRRGSSSPAERRREPSREREDDGVGGQVTGDDPLAVVGRGREPPGDVAQGDVGDARVEDLHEGRHGDDQGQDPRVDGASATRSRQGGRTRGSWSRLQVGVCAAASAAGRGPGLPVPLEPTPRVGAGGALVMDVGDHRQAEEQGVSSGFAFEQVDPDR